MDLAGRVFQSLEALEGATMALSTIAGLLGGAALAWRYGSKLGAVVLLALLAVIVAYVVMAVLDDRLGGDGKRVAAIDPSPGASGAANAAVPTPAARPDADAGGGAGENVSTASIAAPPRETRTAEPVSVHPDARPSYDCAEYIKMPKSAAWRLPASDILCAVPDAAHEDGRLGKVYWEIRKALPESEALALRDSQRKWTEDRIRECPASWEDLHYPARVESIAGCLGRMALMRRLDLEKAYNGRY